MKFTESTFVNALQDAGVFLRLVGKHRTPPYRVPGDWSDKDWLRTILGRTLRNDWLMRGAWQYRSTDLEWWLMGCFVGLLLLVVTGWPWGML